MPVFMTPFLTALALGLLALVPAAQAGCINYTDPRTAPRVEICFDAICEETTQTHICSNTNRALSGFANGWDVTSIGAAGHLRITRKGRELRPEDHARVTCNTLPQGAPCEFFPHAKPGPDPIQAFNKGDRLDGLCLDNLEEGCHERFVPFQGFSIDLCEARCRLTKPVNVRDLEATLYDVSCRSDRGTGNALGSDRVMVLKQSAGGTASLSLLGRNMTRAIVPCP